MATVIPTPAPDVLAAPPPEVTEPEPAEPPEAEPAAAAMDAVPETGRAEAAPAVAAPPPDTPPMPAVAASAEEADPTVAAPDVPAVDVPAVEPPPLVDIETVAARRIAARRPKRQERWRVRKLVAAAAVLAVIDAGLIVGRADIVRVLPQTASLFESLGMPVNLRHLTFKNIRTAQETHDGAKILAVEGTIVATGREAAEVPRLRFAIGAGNGHEIYAWTALPTRTQLAPGETLTFRTRLASPPEQGRSVKVRFFTRLDIATGLR
jgi:hypothetical protein